MNRYFRLFFLLFVSVLFYQCQKEISNTLGSNGSAGTPAPITATLQGNVLDENGNPAMGVTIKAGNKTVSTDARGYFRIPAAPLDRNAALVTAEKQGYFKAFRSFCATSGTNQVVIKLIKKNSVGTIDAATGGAVTMTNGARLELQPNGVVVANSGGSYTGTVHVVAAYIDPNSADINKTVPGSFMANNKAGSRVMLHSFGMLAVELQSPSGERLQIKPGATATLTTPIPASLQASAPSSIALWYIDEQTGIWKEEGQAVKNGSNYVGEVKHFSFWNCDLSIPAIKLSLTLKNNEGMPVVQALVRITRTNGGFSYGYTDSLGQVSGLVPAGEALTLDVLDYCYNPFYSQSTGPFSQNTDLGVISIPAVSNGLVTVKGKILNCNGAAVTNGYALIYYDNSSWYAAVDGSGNFHISFAPCSSTSDNIEVLGIDASTQQQGAPLNFTLTTPETNTGNITACGNSTAEYMNYNLDGTQYSITSQAGDSLMAYNAANQGMTGEVFRGFHGGPSTFLGFNVNATSAGTFPMQQLQVNNFLSNTLLTPFNVTVTNYPQVQGEFWEGSFSGQFTENGNTHNINGSFRVRNR